MYVIFIFLTLLFIDILKSLFIGVKVMYIFRKRIELDLYVMHCSFHPIYSENTNDNCVILNTLYCANSWQSKNFSRFEKLQYINFRNTFPSWLRILSVKWILTQIISFGASNSFLATFITPVSTYITYEVMCQPISPFKSQNDDRNVLHLFLVHSFIQ